MVLHPVEVPLGPPGFCFICESNPDRKTVPMVNTMRLYEAWGASHLNGCKYLCGMCVETAMVVFGWTLPKDVEALKIELVQTKKDLEEAENAVSRLEDFREAADRLAALGFTFEEAQCSDSPSESDSFTNVS